MKRSLALVVSVLVVALTHAQEAQRPAQRVSIARAPAFGRADLTAFPTTGWFTNGGDLFNRRYSPLRQITRDNVAGLKAVWRTRLGGSGTGAKYSGEAQPIVFDGVLYLATGADDVFAVNVDTGEILWTYRANLDEAIDVVCCGWTSRGVALGDGMVYVGQLDGKVVALDQQSGALIWSVQAERWQEGFSITSAPLYYDGLVITGFAGAEYGIRGRVKAFDAVTGALVWTFYTIPGPGEVGHDTWPRDNDVWRRGGASVWQTPAVDPELGLIYFSTGNPGPDFSGAVRRGDNLFSASMVAVEAKTGKYRWHFQQVHHDIWDYDAPSPVVLFDIQINGRTRKAAAEPSKTGWVYILDRVTGEPLIGINERPVPQDARQATSRTQPYPVGDAFVPQSIAIPPEGFRLVNGGRIFTPFSGEESVVAKPGQGGGANWPASSYDPVTGYLYVCAQDRTGIFTGGAEVDEMHSPGDRYLGGRFGSVTFGVTGIFAALDMRTNKLVWQQQWPERCYSGSVTTAGGLVFVGRGDGRFTALDASHGKLLWQFQTGAGVNAPASVFEHRGRQHVAVYSAGNMFAGTPRGDSVWLFSLQGHLGPADAPGAQTAVTPQPAAAVNAIANLGNGRAVFESVCGACHGSQGEGGHGGGPPLTTATNPVAVARVLTEGRNLMPSFGATLSAQEILDVVAHVTEGLPR